MEIKGCNGTQCNMIVKASVGIGQERQDEAAAPEVPQQTGRERISVT